MRRVHFNSFLSFNEVKRGFTLIELLVVISIISLLMAIMLPALGAARETARRTQCAAALRQVNMAALTYVDDNKGYMPLAYAANMPGDPVPTMPWTRRLSAKGYAPEDAWATNPGSKMFVCVSSKVRIINDVMPLHGNYGINHMIAGNVNWDVATNKLAAVGNTTESIKLHDPRLIRLSGTIAFLDAGYSHLNWFYATDSPSAGASAAFYVPGGSTIPASGLVGVQDGTQNVDAIYGRHVGKTVNITWLDGHGSTVPTTFFAKQDPPNHLKYREPWTGLR